MSREKNGISVGMKSLRESKGWTQQKLAQEAGVAMSAIAKVEQGMTPDPAISTLLKVADALGVTLDELVGRTPPRRPSK